MPDSLLVPARTEVDTLSMDKLRRLSTEVRKSVLRMIFAAGSGHVASSLSCVDVLTVLRFDQMSWSTVRREREVFVLSKGHAAPAWYGTLIVAGDLDRAFESRLRSLDSPLQGHPDRSRCEFVDVSTGALGQGLSVALGHARAKRLLGEDKHVYCLIGDGECQEGQIWEAALYAGAKQVSNLVLFVDHNRMQSDGPVRDAVSLAPLADKFLTFGWHVQEVDGHSHDALRAACLAAKNECRRPSVIIANTRKGYLGADQTVLGGEHSAKLTAEELGKALHYLGEAV
ncbi:transketolase [Amycolatopsis sacchari]|uniref:transketolase n=1 Tax=Amycolatopsis sacchari TaxID=115433 RepID=UPI003D75AA62